MLTSAEQTCCLKQCVQHVLLLLLLLLPLTMTLLHFRAGNCIWDPAVTSLWQCLCAEARLMQAFLLTVHATAPSAHGVSLQLCRQYPCDGDGHCSIWDCRPGCALPIGCVSYSSTAAAAAVVPPHRWATLPALRAAHTRSAPLAMQT